MNRNLTEQDKKIIRYSCRAGYMVSLIFVFMNFLFALGFSFHRNKEFHELMGPALILIPFLGLCILVLMNRSCYLDLKSDHKIVEKKKIQLKESKTVYEAGSGTLYIGQKMKPFQAYYLIIENTRYKVEQNFYDSIIEGEIIGFEMTSHRKHLIRMVKFKT